MYFVTDGVPYARGIRLVRCLQTAVRSLDTTKGSRIYWSITEYRLSCRLLLPTAALVDLETETLGSTVLHNSQVLF